MSNDVTVHVLFVSSDPEKREAFKDVASVEDRLSINVASSRQDAVAIASDKTDIVVSELDLPDGSGPSLFDSVGQEISEIGFLLYTEEDAGTVMEQIGVATFTVVNQGSVGLRELVSKLVQMYDEGNYASYPVPEGERKRIEAVREVHVDEDIRERLNEIVEEAVNHFGVSNGFVGLVTPSSQEYVARCGFPIERLPREQTICTYTIMQPETIYVIEDVLEDERFSDNELLAENNINWYVGAQINYREERVATLCLMDEENHVFGQEERDDLMSYVERVEACLERDE